MSILDGSSDPLPDQPIKRLSQDSTPEGSPLGASQASGSGAASQSPEESPSPEVGGEKEAPSKKRHSALREYFVTTVVCTIFALFVTSFVVHPMTVPTPSMESTILVGDRLLIDKFSFRNRFQAGLGIAPSRPIQRGDILVFKYPDDPETLYVKRAIGIPGDTLEIRDKQVYINGEPLEESYKRHSDEEVRLRRRRFHGYASRRDNFDPIEIPRNKYFVMGDNRDDSADSRYFGLLDEKLIVGRPLIVFWSYKDAPDAYRRNSPSELIQLYGERIAYFFTRTRWSRIGHIIR